MDNNLIIHHNDMDGYMSAVVLQIFLGATNTICLDYDSGYVPAEELCYGDYDTIYIVDYSFNEDIMQWLFANRNVVWIDHHVSAIDKSKKHGYDSMSGIRKIGLCGAELTWEYCFPNEKMPSFLRLVGDYDTFRSIKNREYHDTVVMPFFYGVTSCMEKINPDNFGKRGFLFGCASDLSSCSIKDFVVRGRLIKKYLDVTYAENAKSSFIRNCGNLRVLCINSVSGGSSQLELFFDADKHDLMCVFHYDGKRWCYGFYTDTIKKPNVDVSKIALSLGGGGHKGASGATSDVLLSWLK